MANTIRLHTSVTELLATLESIHVMVDSIDAARKLPLIKQAIDHGLVLGMGLKVDLCQASSAAATVEYTPGTWYEAKDRDDLQAFFLSRLPSIREAAREHGYAIGLHGSLRRDMDLIATPWRNGASDKDVLAHAIAMAACGITREGPYQWEAKPAGRMATSLSCCWPSWYSEAGAGHIDLSVTPRAEPAQVPEDVWLLAAGEDGKHSRLVVGWAALEKAWLDVHYFGVDHDNLDDQQRGTLAVLNDSNEWCHDQEGNRFSLHINYEGDWVSVTAVTDASVLLTAAQATGGA